MSDASESPQDQLSWALYIGYAAIVLMMSCLGWVIYQILSWVLPGIRFSLLVPFEIFVAFEAVVTTNSMNRIEAFSGSWITRRAVEWIVLIVLAKLLTYASVGIKQLAADLLIWDTNFEYFFTLEFVGIVIVTAIIWIIACHLTAQLVQLFGSHENLDLETKGIGLIDRQGIRQGMTTLIFIVGALMLAIITTLFIMPQALPAPIQPSVALYWGVMLYFVGGLILLAEANLFSLHSRWYLHGIQSSPKIWLRWIFFSVVLIVLASILANILPTSYSFNLLGVIQTAIEYLIYGITFLEFLIFTPLVFLLNYVISLFGGNPVKVPQLPTPQALPPPESSGGASHTPFLDLLRSFLFWTVFFGIIFIAFRVYIRQNQDVIDSLKKQPYLKWLLDIWIWIKGLFFKAGAWTQNAIAVGRASLIKTRREVVVHLPQAIPAFEKFPPRQKIRLTYLIMTEWIGSLGYPRQKQDTPGEYAHRLDNIYPPAAADIQQLTDLFIAARYSLQQMTNQQADAAKARWNSLKALIQNSSLSDSEK